MSTNRRIRRLATTSLGLALSASVLLGASGTSHAAGDWNPGAGQDYLTDYFYLPSGIKVNRPKPPGAKRWAVAKKIEFRGTTIHSGWNDFPDGTRVRWKGRGDYLRFWKQGTEAYLTTLPVFNGTSISDRPLDTPYVYPPSINGALRIEYDIYEKVSGRRAKWDCSIYYKEVCRWRPGRPAVAPHVIARALERSQITTVSGTPKFTWPEYVSDCEYGVYLGTWSLDKTMIPSDLLDNPLLPIDFEESYFSGSLVCGAGRIDTNVQIKLSIVARRITNP